MYCLMMKGEKEKGIVYKTKRKKSKSTMGELARGRLRGSIMLRE